MPGMGRPSQGVKKKRKRRSDYKKARNDALLKDYDEGAGYKALGKKYGINPQRVKTIVELYYFTEIK